MRRRFLTVLLSLLVLLSCSNFNSAFAEDEIKQLLIVSENIEVKLDSSDESETLTIDGQSQFFKKGDIYDINLSNTLEDGSIWYQVTLKINETDYLGYVKATDTALIEADDYRLFEVSSDSIPMKLYPSDDGESLTVNDQVVSFTSGVIYTVHKTVTFNDETVWFMLDYNVNDTVYTIYINSANAVMLDMDFEEYMDDQGFPEDYQTLLRKLHKAHPNWTFVAYQTGIEWDTMVAKESVFRKNLISGSNVNLRSTDEGCYDPITGKFIPLDGTSWYQANSETIAYYMDPRNFMDEKRVFMFLQLSFNENESADLISGILSNTFMKGNDSVDGVAYSQIFYNAGQTANVSPIYLATLAKQEQGTSGSAAVTGASFTYNGKTYSGLYNFYNIGATSGTDNWKKGLIYANGGEDGSATSYSRPWTSPAKSITGGAQWIAAGYIEKGQDTMYTQKFNCTSYSTFGHQYMTNVQAAYSQGGIMYNTYYNNGVLDLELTFKIPVYNNIPAKTELPTSITYPGEPDDPDPAEEYTGDFIVDMDLLNVDGYLTGFTLGQTYGELKTKMALISSSATIKILVNGSEVSDTTTLSTGQTLTFANGDGTSTYTVIIRGDLNGDGNIDTKDYLIYRKTLLGVYTMSPLEIKAADMNGETEISTKGYLVLRKYLLGVSDINQ